MQREAAILSGSNDMEHTEFENLEVSNGWVVEIVILHLPRTISSSRENGSASDIEIRNGMAGLNVDANKFVRVSISNVDGTRLFFKF